MAGNDTPWVLPSRGRVGMISLIIAESAIFMIFVAAYIFYIGKSLDGPTPRQVLKIPIFITVCLLSSSLTMHWAIAALRKGKTASFNVFWLITLVLGAIFLAGTGREWQHLIYQEGFTIQTNLFGTTYYSLGRVARVSRHGRIDRTNHRGDSGPRRENETRAQRAVRSIRSVLAFC